MGKRRSEWWGGVGFQTRPGRPCYGGGVAAIAGIWLLLAAGEVNWAAEVALRLPLEGYCRVGRYMPVSVSVASAAGATESGGREFHVSVGAEGMVPAVLPLEGGRVDAVVPVLVLRVPAGPMEWSTDGGRRQVRQPLRALAEDERLVGVAGQGDMTAATALAAELFPGKSPILIRLDPAQPLPGPAVAWGTLDAVVLDGAAAQRLSEAERAELLGAGTVLAVGGEVRPDQQWRWQRQGGYWVLRYEPAGPRGGGIDDLAYLPTYSWNVDWPRALRRSIVLFAAVFVLAVLLLSLWRSRWAALLIVVVVGLAIGAVAYWRAWQSPILQAAGQVAVRNGGSELATAGGGTGSLVQEDRWAYQASLDAVESALLWSDLTWPVFAGPRQVEQMGMTLRCQGDGRPQAFVYHLPRQMRIAFLSRRLRLGGGDGAPVTEPVTSPLRPLVRELYLGPQMRLVGQIAPSGGDLSAGAVVWPTVVVERGLAYRNGAAP